MCLTTHIRDSTWTLVSIEQANKLMRKEINAVMAEIEALPEVPNHNKERTTQMLYDIYSFCSEEGTTTNQVERLELCGIMQDSNTRNLVYHACQFALGNAKSTNGILDVAIKYNEMGWFLDCGEVSLAISSRVAQLLIEELPRI